MKMPYKLRNFVFHIRNFPKRLVFMYGSEERKKRLANKTIKYGFRGRPGTIEDVCGGADAGWANIIERLVLDLFALGWNGEVVQVKEKFGGLRFYINNGSDAIYDRIEAAENESLKVCEVCGASGVLRGGGWLKTLCDEHAGDRPLYAGILF